MGGKAAVTNLFTEDSLSPIVPTFLLRRDKSHSEWPFWLLLQNTENHDSLGLFQLRKGEAYVLFIGLNGKG